MLLLLLLYPLPRRVTKPHLSAWDVPFSGVVVVVVVSFEFDYQRVLF